jgi:nucleoside-diphosphate-sugar epimerase
VARYLLTGTAGFIGAQVAAALLARGDQVVGVDNLNDAYDRFEGLAPEASTTHLAFHFNAWTSRRRGPGGGCLGPFEAVINLAARAGVRASVRLPELYARTNMLGALHLLEMCRAQAIPKFVQASTSSLYGAKNARPFREDADISRPLSPYAATKGAAELLCHSFHALHGLDVTILRYFTVFGPAGRRESIFRSIQWVMGSAGRLRGRQQERTPTLIIPCAARFRPLGFGSSTWAAIAVMSTLLRPLSSCR